jgi:vacuolar-type H+-ATPase subunit H
LLSKTLKAVTEIEKEARQIVYDAEKKADQLVEDAKAKAKQKHAEAVAQANEDAEKLIADANAQAEQERTAYAEDLTSRLEQEKEAAIAKTGNVVDAVVAELV